MVPLGSFPNIPGTQRRRLFGPLLIAVLVEGLIVTAALFWLIRHGPPTVSSALGPIRLDLTKLPSPLPAPTAPPASAPPAAPDEAEQAEPSPDIRKPVPDLPPLDMPAEAPEEVMPHSYASPKLPPMPLPNLALLPKDHTGRDGPDQPAPRPANGQVDQMSEFIRKVNEALRAAGRHLNATRGIKFSGIVDIAVHYKDGRAWGPWIVKSSGFPELDQATLEAATMASWPPPPPDLAGRELVLPVNGSFW